MIMLMIQSRRATAPAQAGLDGPDRFEDLMGKPRKQHPDAESIFTDNPFIEGIFAWMDSPEGENTWRSAMSSRI